MWVVLAILILIAALLAFAVWGAHRVGKLEPEIKIAKQNLGAAEEAHNVQNAIDRLPNAAVSQRLSKWFRK